ncbi:MAG: phytanoyl-CoA dioxygenase family protein [Planctomycetaceae bacterium]
MTINLSPANSPGISGFSAAEVDDFQKNGYAVVRGLADRSLVESMREITIAQLQAELGPCEFEVELQYPGAPDSPEKPGGRTIRRLKQAISRHPVFLEWVSNPELVTRLRQLLGPEIVMPLAHHNCIMTKQPRFSSDTGWHQDIRYWSFNRPELVSVWLALGEEKPENGCLRLIPGSHLLQYDRSQLDDALFLREDVPANNELIHQQITAELQPGDVLFFHSRTFHSASRNYTDQTKYSAVFTFRPADNLPNPGTRSASLPELRFP